MTSFLSSHTFNTSTNPNRQSLAFDSIPSFLSPDTADTTGNSSDAAAMLSQQRAKPKATGNTTRRISAPALTWSTGECDTWTGVLGQIAKRDNSPTQDISVEPGLPLPRTDFSGLSTGSAFGSPLPNGGAAPSHFDRLSPVKTSSANKSNVGQTVDLSAAKLQGGSNVPRLDGPDKFRRPSKGHVHHSSSDSTTCTVTTATLSRVFPGASS
ncbi:hypothetical protein EDB92DRAFT_1946964 [Lactarius akahatsu]|uniref:Uncharacterized protein n=1 Tax=Lactarius akahatsu TaxID=416441 RepID=A0AAD4Q7B5_9AGAM|nr:hypothetical protein EDB92DRAFT_1946964 [Lactarius akahatsu]